RLLDCIPLASSFSMVLEPPCPTHVPYTTLFRSFIGDFGLAPTQSPGTGETATDGLQEQLAGARRAERRRILTDHVCEHVAAILRSEEHTSELQSRFDIVCRLLLEKKNKT